MATNAIICWSTEYHGLAVGALRAGGQVDDEVLAHICPTHHEHVHFYGIHSVDLDTDGCRPRRPAGRMRCRPTAQVIAPSGGTS